MSVTFLLSIFKQNPLVNILRSPILIDDLAAVERGLTNFLNSKILDSRTNVNFLNWNSSDLPQDDK
jgi:hypothetical protein